jgi:hypothetical protein
MMGWRWPIPLPSPANPTWQDWSRRLQRLRARRQTNG